MTAVTRLDSNSKLPEGVRVARVDYNNLAGIVDVLRGQQVLIVTMAVTAPRDTIAKLVEAAAQAGVRYIMPNWFGHDASNKKLCDDSMLTHMGDAIDAQISHLGASVNLRLVCNFWYEFSLGGGPDRFGFDFLNKKRSLTLFDKGDVPINVTTWAQCARAVANLFSLKELPEDESDASFTLSEFNGRPIYISSFRLSQLDMFEAVKKVTGTTDEDWEIDYDSSEKRWKEGHAAVLKGDFGQFTKMLYSRNFFSNGGGDYESSRTLDNQALSLPVEDLLERTAVGIRMAENNEVTRTH